MAYDHGLRVEVEEGRCIGVASCEVCAPTVFRLNHFRIAEVLDPSSASREKILEAAMDCPVDAIIVETEDGRQIWPR
ncbi:MAG: ferredoxin [Thermomicrobiales bacterium]